LSSLISDEVSSLQSPHFTRNDPHSARQLESPHPLQYLNDGQDEATHCKRFPVAFIEVDGPHHYRSDGCLLRKDILKETLYRMKYPYATFTRIKFDQVVTEIIIRVMV
jgi:hypothetical protein